MVHTTNCRHVARRIARLRWRAAMLLLARAVLTAPRATHARSVRSYLTMRVVCACARTMNTALCLRGRRAMRTTRRRLCRDARRLRVYLMLLAPCRHAAPKKSAATHAVSPLAPLDAAAAATSCRYARTRAADMLRVCYMPD